MIKPGVPKNEKQRVQALLDLGIMDSGAEHRFDRLTRLAANYFNVQTCVVSLVDNERQWFKSKFGSQACETSRDISFCAHAILQDEIMVVPDARTDQRFADNPLVIKAPYTVFYAGAPLSTVDGFKIGTLCLVDDKPRNLDSQQLVALRDFADMVQCELNNLSENQLQKERHKATVRTDSMLAVFPDSVFIIQKDFRYVAFNDHPDFGTSTEQLIGRTIAEVLPTEIAEIFEKSLQKAFKTGELTAFRYQFQIDEKLNFFEARAKRISETEVLVVIRNVTEEYLQMMQLERLSMVAQQTNNAVIITDNDKHVVWVNDGFTKLSGFTLEEMSGKNPGVKLQGAETNAATVDKMREAHKNKQNYTVDIVNYHKDGHPYWVRITCNPWFSESGEFKGFIAIQSDVSEEIKNIQQIQQSQKLLAAVIDANAIGTWILNLQTRTLEINETWAKLLGYTLEELEPVDMDTWQDMTHADDLRKCLKMFKDYDSGLIDYYEAPIRMKHKEGHWIWIRTRGSITSRTADGKAELTLGTHLDINAQMLAEARLQEQYDYMQLLFDKMIDGIVIYDTDGKVQSFNPASELILGYSSEEVLNQDISLIIPSIRNMQLGGQLQYAEGKRKNGDAFAMEIGIVESRHKQETIFIGMLRDVTERKNAEQAIHELAYFDSLSGLPNRRLMFDRLQHALLKSERNHKYVAVLFVDFDNFKQINDSAGHEVGDLLLQQIATRLKNSVRESDTVARLGGDEFIIILEDLDSSAGSALSQAEAAALKIKEHLNEAFQLNDISYIGSCCIGVAVCDDPSISSTELLKQADLAMYQAKLSGKNAISFFAVEMQEKVNTRIKVEQDLRSALINDELDVFYQPQVDLDGYCIGAEGLLRWHHPHLGLISPMQFIPIAEESGLIVPIGRWVLKQACMCLANWANSPERDHLVLAINISVVELSQDDWVESVLKIVLETGANPTKLKLEVTESVMAFDIDTVTAKLSELRANGISISLDDFGTGYSSLTYLKSLPLNQLKIDKSFVRDILVDPDDKAIVETIVNLANIMLIDVIAEGVETQAQLAVLKDMGCSVFQGYLFGKPEPLENFKIHGY